MNRTGLISRRPGLLILACVLAVLPVGSWTYVNRSFGDDSGDIETVTIGIDVEAVTNEIDIEESGIEKTVAERYRLNHSAILARCAADLGTWWPVPTEWTMSGEGCVVMPERAPIIVPELAFSQPHAYRLFDLDTNQWNSTLSRASFLRMAGNFPGRVLQGNPENPDQFVLVLPYEPEEETVDDEYVPEPDPAMVLRRSFVGIIRLDRNGDGDEIGGFVDLNPVDTIMRLSDARLAPVHVYRKSGNRRTGIRVLPEQVRTRQIQVENQVDVASY